MRLRGRLREAAGALILAACAAAGPARAQDSAQNPAQTPAQIVVGFIAPERFTDAENRYGSGVSLRVTLAEIRRIFVELGSRVLQPGQRLSIEVLDIDLAGLDSPGVSVPFGPRVVTDLTPPRFRLRYVLTENRRVVLKAEESVSELDFLTRYARRSSGATFYYERELIRDWLQKRIVLR